MSHRTNQNQSKQQSIQQQQYQSSQRQNENTMQSIKQMKQNQNKQDFEIASELDKRQLAYGQPISAQQGQKLGQQTKAMHQPQWNEQQRHDLEIANELGANYAANVAQTKTIMANRPTEATTQQLMSRNYQRLKEEHKKNDVEFSVDLPNEHKAKNLSNNKTANQFNQNDKSSYGNVNPKTDSNRFEK